MERNTGRVRIPMQKRGRETKTQIIKAGLKLFSRKGFHNTNAKEIALEAGVATGSFYAYFKDKKMLFLEILQEYYESISTRSMKIDMEDIIKESSRRELISTIVQNVIEAHEISPGFHREIEVMRNSDADVKKLVSEYEKKILKNTIKLLSVYHNNIRIKDIEAAAVIISRSIEEVVHIIKFDKPRIDETRLTNELVDMIFRYLF